MSTPETAPPATEPSTKAEPPKAEPPKTEPPKLTGAEIKKQKQAEKAARRAQEKQQKQGGSTAPVVSYGANATISELPHHFPISVQY